MNGCGVQTAFSKGFFRRRDGTVLTRNCPVGFARLRARWSAVRTAVAAALLRSLLG